MNQGIVAGIVALVLIVGGFLVFSGKDDKAAMMQKEDAAAQQDGAMMEKPGDAMRDKEEGAMMEKSGETMIEKDAAMMDKKDGAMMESSGDAMMKKDVGAMMDKGGAMAKSGTYQAYSPEKLALAASEDVLIFFHATWCPICRGLESEIKADMTKIPAGVNILKVDYDTATTLRQKYGVTVQHTFVQVDASGTSIQKFSDASTLADVVSRVK